MKKLSLFFIFLLGFLSVVSGFSASNGMLFEKISTENRIFRQVNQELEKILPKDSFAVFVSASLIQQRKREVSQGEVFKRQTRPPSPNPAKRNLASGFPAYYGGGEDVLPGFSAIDNSHQRQQKDFMQKLISYIDHRLDRASPTNTQKETYHFIDSYKLKRVLLDVLVDKRIPEKQYALAERSLIKKMRASFGNQVSVRFQKTKLMSYDPPPTFSEKLLTLLKQNGIGLLLVFLGLLFLFSLLAWLFQRKPFSPHAMSPQMSDPFANANNYGQGRRGETFGRGDKTSPFQDEKGEGGEEEGQKIPFVSPETLHCLLDKFVDQMVKDPLLSRHFLRQLESDDKTKLLHCFNTHGMQENLKQTMNLSSLESEAENVWESMDEEELNAEKHQLLLKVYNEMKHYCKVMGVQLKRRFGYISLLDDQELKQVFGQVPLKFLSGVTKMMPSQQREDLLGSLPLEKKKELFSFLTSDESEISMEEMKEYDKELKYKAYDVINTASQGGSASNASIMDSLVSEVQDAQYILSEDLMRENTVLADRYKYHRVTFDQFLSDDRDSVLNCLDEVSNEVLAQSLLIVDEGLSQNLLSLLSPDRKAIVNSLMSSLRTGEYVAQSEIAQNEILKNYKNYLYSRRAS